MASNKIALTSQRVKDATCPPDKDQALIWDALQPGLALRVYRTGHKVFFVYYRVSGGRRAPQRWDQIGDADAISLKDARDAARLRLGAVAKGGDPAGERKAEAKRAKARLEPAMTVYEADLERRHVVKRTEVISLLRRELARPLGNVDLAALTRNDLVERIAAVEASGRPGAAQELRKVAAVFLGWCADTGRISASPLAGWRRQRKTKAQRLARPGRALEDWEIPILWRAAESNYDGFGLYLQVLVLLGQRRTETALMRWRDLDFKERVWIVPAAVTKSGREHRVPLSDFACDLLEWRARRASSDMVFLGRGGRPMTGWSKRLPSIYERTAAGGMARWTLHDLRRTMRTGLGRLGVDRVVAELLLNHAISDELTAIYDRAEYWQQRVDAAERWARHIKGLIEAGYRIAQLHHARP